MTTGVSARPSHLAKGAIGLSGLFKYHGGGIIKSPKVFLLLVGRGAADFPYEDNLVRFLGDLVSAGSEFMNLLHQYGVQPGIAVGSDFLYTAASSLTDKEIRKIVRTAIRHLGSNVQVVVHLAAGIGVDDGSLKLCEPAGDNAFGYHDYFYSGLKKICYAVVPALTDDCLETSCGTGPCSLSLAQSQFDRTTQVVSHELAELFTDPSLDGWNAGTAAWENADICNAQPASLTIDGRTWNIQKTYSKYDDERGLEGCQAISASPLSPYPLRAGFFALLGTYFGKLFRIIKDNL